jgi:hypothetical protein
MTKEQITKRDEFIEEAVRLFKELEKHIEPVKKGIHFLNHSEENTKAGLFIDMDILEEHFKTK